MTSPGAPQAGQTATPRRTWSDLGPRFASAAVLIAIAAAAVWLGGLVLALLLGLLFAGVYREWETMVALKRPSTGGWVLMALMVVAAVVFPLWGVLATAAVIVVAAILGLALGGPGAPWRAAGVVFFGLVIVAMLATRGEGIDGFYAGLFLCVVVWITDSGAFFTGRQIGGEKLAPDISPSKTWSGALGGLAAGTIAGTLIWLLVTHSPWYIGTLLAFAMSILGQIGDLAESAVKRRFKVKDSGDLIPGHGGLMDRIDSTTFGVLFLFAVGTIHADFSHVAAGFLHW